MSNKRNLIITAIVGIAVVLGFVALRGVNFPPSGTEGAIGAAKRYQADQIGAKDVQLQDAEIQAFIQSDTFHKLATNAEFRNIVKEMSFQEVAGMKGYQSILENKAQAMSLANKEFAHFLVDPATVAMVSSDAFAKVSSEINLSELLRTPAFWTMMSSTLEKKPTAMEFQNMVLEAKGLPTTFIEFASKNGELVLAAMQPALLEGKEMFLSLNGAAELLATPGLGSLLESKPFATLVTLEAHETLMQTPELLSQAFSSEVFSRIVETQQWSVLEKGFTAIEQQ